MMKRFFSLFRARNREFYRDRGSVSWAFLLPILIVVAIGAAFADRQEVLFEIGVFSEGERLPQWTLANKAYVDIEHFAPGEQRAFDKLRYHQLDMLVEEGRPLRYWTNEQSERGRLLQSLLLDERDDALHSALSGRKLSYIDWVMPGILAMNMMFAALFGAGYVMVRYRKNGVLKRLQATPVRAVEFIAAQIASRLLIIISASLMLFVGAGIFLDFLMLGSHLLLFCIAVLGGSALIALGLLCASRTESEELAGGLLNLMTFPMMLLSEVWFSLDKAPHWMQGLSQAFPLTHLVQAARAVMLEGAGIAEVGLQLTILAVMTAVFLCLAAGLFRWHNS